jgi:hypothetical protein
MMVVLKRRHVTRPPEGGLGAESRSAQIAGPSRASRRPLAHDDLVTEQFRHRRPSLKPLPSCGSCSMPSIPGTWTPSPQVRSPYSGVCRDSSGGRPLWGFASRPQTTPREGMKAGLYTKRSF